MAHTRGSTRFSDWLTSRGGAWVALGVALALLVGLFGLFGGAEAPSRNMPAPADAESTRVSELLAEFPNADEQSVLIVATRDGGGALSAQDLTALTELGSAISPEPAAAPTVSEDGEAAVIITPVTVGADNTETAEVIGELRAQVAQHAPSGLTLQVTGGPTFGADIAGAFEGADFTLLFVTILIVAILLLATYRSPILWLIPLTVVALADGLAGRVTAAAGAEWDLQFDAGIISVLVFGAGTNYALLLISRYREELLTTTDHRSALSTAWRKSLPAIVASNLTVVLALLTLLLAVIPGTRGIGIPAALGLLIALAAVLFLLPPFLAVCGRGVFWPFVPRPGSAQRPGRGWRAFASRVVRRPMASLLAGLAVLAIMASGLWGTSVGLDQAEKFRVQSESAAGLESFSAHFPAGEAQPIFVLTEHAAVPDVLSAIREVEGVVRAHPAGEPSDAGLTKLMVTSEYAPSSEANLAQVTELREAVHAVPGAEALVGGAAATELDARAGNAQDLRVIAPLLLAVGFLVLVFLLRSLIAPALLLAVNLMSAVAAIGAGAWLSRVMWDQHALDPQVPLLAFLFLVALGIDYTIFLVHRAKHEAVVHGTRDGMVEAITHTGSVITSAGIVLAAVFAALGVLPLVTLGQLGLIVGLGVLVDTLLVRSMIVPALFSLLGDRIWWPGRIAPRPARMKS
ncbi:MMPL family transporter [Leucobacter chromiireducens]|uniref:MMPL family transporter n=1 Tax=Leucobacter chromiireducens subsp. solipictus TaxID=398235 RepID=A0ABS1SM84_9MICO|nr:MMPL family transporter [Leucobacter chromiireducens]MBL3680639.1 MMPL family transporter [Leucobacter chromiireducens subsp. solipictus]